MACRWNEKPTIKTEDTVRELGQKVWQRKTWNTTRYEQKTGNMKKKQQKGYHRKPAHAREKKTPKSEGFPNLVI